MMGRVVIYVVPAMATRLDSSALTRDEPQILREGEASSVFIKGRQAALEGEQAAPLCLHHHRRSQQRRVWEPMLNLRSGARQVRQGSVVVLVSG